MNGFRVPGWQHDMTDRNARARLAARIRTDRRLTAGARLVWHSIAFGFVGARAYAFPSFEAIAIEAGVSRATVVRAIPQLERFGYVAVYRSYARRKDRRGRLTPRRAPNRYVLPLPSHEAHSAPGTKPLLKTMPAPAPLPADLAAVLARLGTAIADKRDREAGQPDRTGQ